MESRLPYLKKETADVQARFRIGRGTTGHIANILLNTVVFLRISTVVGTACNLYFIVKYLAMWIMDYFKGNECTIISDCPDIYSGQNTVFFAP